MKAQERQKKYFDKSVQNSKVDYIPGDKILLLDKSRRKGSLSARFKGPYVIREVKGGNVKLNLLDGNPLSNYSYKIANIKLFKEGIFHSIK